MKQREVNKKREQKANKQQKREGCYDAFWMVEGKGERRRKGIKVEEIKGIFWIASRIGATHWVKNKKIGGDR